MPSRSALNQVSFRRPGTASILTPKAGTAKAWITSVGGDQHADHLAHRHDQLVVDGEQARIDGRVFLAVWPRSSSCSMLESKETGVLDPGIRSSSTTGCRSP